MGKARSSNDTIQFVEDLKRRWMETVDAIPDPLMMVNDRFEIIKANKAIVTPGKYPIKEIIGKACHQIFADRDTPCPGCPKIRQEAGEDQGESWEFENPGNDRFYEVTVRQLHEAEGQPDVTLMIYRDRTEARQLRSRLLQHEKLASIGLLAGGVAHELNNPLGGILIFAQMLLRELPESSDHHRDVREIESATLRCKDIVENLLDFARAQPAGRRQAVTESVDMCDAMEAALNFAVVGGQDKHLNVRREYSLTGYHWTCNRNKMVQLFLNLIQNALQAMPDGGDLTLRSSIRKTKSGDQALFEVEDTGSGIEKRDLDKVFDLFFTRKEPGSGTGLGLSICHRIAEDSGGTMEVESCVNKGTVFRLVIPWQAQTEEVS